MANQETPSGASTPDEQDDRVATARSTAEEPSFVTKHGGLLIPLVVFGLMALAIVATLVMD